MAGALLWWALSYLQLLQGVQGQANDGPMMSNKSPWVLNANVIVRISIGLPMPLSKFNDAKRQHFRECLTRVAGVDESQLSTQVNEQTTSLLSVDVEIAVQVESVARSAASKLTADNIDAELAGVEIFSAVVLSAAQVVLPVSPLFPFFSHLSPVAEWLTDFSTRGSSIRRDFAQCENVTTKFEDAVLPCVLPINANISLENAAAGATTDVLVSIGTQFNSCSGTKVHILTQNALPDAFPGPKCTLQTTTDTFPYMRYYLCDVCAPGMDTCKSQEGLWYLNRSLIEP
jgi:hypothetical protein